MLPENFHIIHANYGHDPILRNLFEFYLHDLSEWFKFDQLPEGRYTESTERYWAKGHDVHLLYAQEIPVGFGIVGPAEKWTAEAGAKDMEEFFIVRRHRHTGVPAKFAKELWRLQPGLWLVRVFQPNAPALPFWRKSIAEFSNGQYREETREVNGNLWSYFSFDSPKA